MKNEQKTKKGFFGILRESFSKTGGCCCGPGESCDGSTTKAEKPQSKETTATTKPAQNSTR